LQIVALFILLLSALVMESVVKVPFLPGNSTKSIPTDDDAEEKEEKKTEWLLGVVPVLLASLISGLAGAWTQRSLQWHAQNSLWFSAQLSVFSALTVLASLSVSPDRERIRTSGWSVGWTLQTWIPLTTNAAGGLLVGLVTKHAGVVPKGFALIFGMFLSGILQNRLSGDAKVTGQQWAGGALAAVSLYLHAAFPATNRK
jgi:UDP-sugar transporter A1/2/3